MVESRGFTQVWDPSYGVVLNILEGWEYYPIITGWWFGTFFIFPSLGIMIPTDELIVFRGVGLPPTSYHPCIHHA